LADLLAKSMPMQFSLFCLFYNQFSSFHIDLICVNKAFAFCTDIFKIFSMQHFASTLMTIRFVPEIALHPKSHNILYKS